MNTTTIINGEGNSKQKPTSIGFLVDISRGERIGRDISESFSRPGGRRGSASLSSDIRFGKI